MTTVSRRPIMGVMMPLRSDSFRGFAADSHLGEPATGVPAGLQDGPDVRLGGARQAARRRDDDLLRQPRRREAEALPEGAYPFGDLLRAGPATTRRRQRRRRAGEQSQ